MNAKHIGPNAVEINAKSMSVLFSYATPVAACVVGVGWYRTAQKHSTTTSRHINGWLGGVHAEEMPQTWFDAIDLTEQTIGQEAAS